MLSCNATTELNPPTSRAKSAHILFTNFYNFPADQTTAFNVSTNVSTTSPADYRQILHIYVFTNVSITSSADWTASTFISTNVSITSPADWTASTYVSINVSITSPAD